VSGEPNQTLVTVKETEECRGLTAARVVAEARTAMRDDMSNRLGGMMESLRSGLKAELTEMAADLRDATLVELAKRFAAINHTLKSQVSPIIKPSVRSRLRELKSVLIGQFVQMLREEGAGGDVLEDARKTADETVKELVPNLGKLD
jgi:hypothetical protein